MWSKRECRRVETLLWIMAQGKVDDRQTERVQAHLRHCPACRAQWEACRQTQAGLAALRDRPVPASQTGWLTVQARLAAANGVPAAARNTRGERVRYRAAIVGRRALLTGAASMLALFLLLARPGVSPRQADNSLLNIKLAVTKSQQSPRPLKPNVQFAAFTLVGAMPTSASASPTTLSGVDWTAEQEERHGNQTPNIRRLHTRPDDRRVAITRAAGRRHLALALLHRRMRSNQMAAGWNNADREPAVSGLTVMVQAGSMEPEYVLTTIEGASSAPRSFIMDSINVDAQHTGQANVDGLAVPAAPDESAHDLNNDGNSRQNDTQNNVPANGGDAQIIKEIRVW